MFERISCTTLVDAFAEAGIWLVWREPADYFSYPLVEFAHRVPFLVRSSAGVALLKAVFSLDGALARVESLAARSRHWIWVGEKGHVGHDGTSGRRSFDHPSRLQ